VTLDDDHPVLSLGRTLDGKAANTSGLLIASNNPTNSVANPAMIRGLALIAILLGLALAW
jgi:hypothetical protein